MNTMISVREETNARLEELRARIERETGRVVTQEQLLDDIVTDAMDRRAELIDLYADAWEGLTEAEITAWLAGTCASGASVDEHQLDDALYGSQPD